MVHEIRRIYFTDREVAAAVALFLSTKQDSSVCSEEIAEITVSDSLEVGVHLKTRRPEQPEQLKLDIASLGAALVRFCAAKGIPLPRKGKKSLRREPDTVVLVLETHVGSYDRSRT